MPCCLMIHPFECRGREWGMSRERCLSVRPCIYRSVLGGVRCVVCVVPLCFPSADNDPEISATVYLPSPFLSFYYLPLALRIGFVNISSRSKRERTTHRTYNAKQLQAVEDALQRDPITPDIQADILGVPSSSRKYKSWKTRTATSLKLLLTTTVSKRN